MPDWLQQQVARYRSRGLLIDTNLLLLFVVGSYDPRLISTFKRTKTYTRDDFDLLTELVSQFQVLVTTPNILSETSNFVGQIAAPAASQVFKVLARAVDVLEEQYVPSRAAAGTKPFGRFGLADAVTAICAKEKYLVLTDDLPLYNVLVHGGTDAVNFNHIRTLGWR